MFAEMMAIEAVQQTRRATAVDFNSDVDDQQSSMPATFGGRVFDYFSVGTFGLLRPEYVQASTSTSSWAINQIKINNSQPPIVDQANTVASDLAFVRQTTNLSVSELARVCGVSRQAVHDWINGGALSPKNAQRISDLTRAIDILLAAGVDASPQSLRRKLAGNVSILESVQSDGKAVDLANQLVDTLTRELAQRKRLAGRLAGHKPQYPIAEFGAPHLIENI